MECSEKENRNDQPQKCRHEKGNVEAYEMYRTFNCGVGMIIAVPASEQDNTLAILKDAGEDAFVVGTVAKAQGDEERVELLNL